MMRPSAETPGISLQPGEFHLSRNPSILQTILGSCVSVTFWSPRLRTGAMSHGVLPRCPALLPLNSNIVAEGCRYVDFSIRYLVEQFELLGVSRDHIEVKLFGGADVLPVAARPGKPTVGAQNCQVALQVLQEEGLLVRASDLGGVRGRTIHFNTGTGDVFLHRLGKLDSAAISKQKATRL
jgi:chemotaxis protein CheD